MTESGDQMPGNGGTALQSTDFGAAIRANRRNTRILCLLLIAVGGAIGYGFGWALELNFLPPVEVGGMGRAASAPVTGWSVTGWSASPWGLRGGLIVIAVSSLWTFIAIAFGDRLVVALAGGKEVSAEDEPMLHNVVEEMAIASGLPKPRVVVVETPALNAFAAGRRPEKATIGVTRGLVDKLERAELQGVIGHEMGHIANNDILYATAVGVIVGVIVLAADFARLMVRGMAYSSRGSRRRGGANIVALVIFLVLGLVAPLAAKLVQMAISRQREYLADATSVRFTRNPRGLIGALEKINGSTERYAGASRAIQHLFIANPLRNFSENAGALFATHPALSQRIERLRDLK